MTTPSEKECNKSNKKLDDMVDEAIVNSDGNTTYYTYYSGLKLLNDRPPPNTNPNSYTEDELYNEVIKISIEKDDSKYYAELISYKKDKKSFQRGDWIDGNNTKKVWVGYDSSIEEIDINMVYTGKKQGICTKAVAYTMKALIDHINKQNLFALKGMVLIQSFNGCAAFNCYNRAFEMNGFVLKDDNEFKSFQKKYLDTHPTDILHFEFYSFKNEDQEKKKNQYMKKMSTEMLTKKRKRQFKIKF